MHLAQNLNEKFEVQLSHIKALGFLLLYNQIRYKFIIKSIFRGV